MIFPARLPAFRPTILTLFLSRNLGVWRSSRQNVPVELCSWRVYARPTRPGVFFGRIGRAADFSSLPRPEILPAGSDRGAVTIIFRSFFISRLNSGF